MQLKLRSQCANEEWECCLNVIEIPTIRQHILLLPQCSHLSCCSSSEGKLITDSLVFPDVSSMKGFNILTGSDQMWANLSAEITRFALDSPLVATNSKLSRTFQGRTSHKISSGGIKCDGLLKSLGIVALKTRNRKVKLCNISSI